MTAPLFPYLFQWPLANPHLQEIKFTLILQEQKSLGNLEHWNVINICIISKLYSKTSVEKSNFKTVCYKFFFQ